MPETEKPLGELMRETAEAITKELPDELLTRLIGAKIREALDALNRNYGSDTLMKIVEQAVSAKITWFLENDEELKAEVDRIARGKARDAIAIAKNCVVLKERPSRY